MTKNHYQTRDENLETAMIMFELDQLHVEEPRATTIKRRKKSVRELFTWRDRYYALQRDHYRCVLCGSGPKVDGVKVEVDHIIPVSKGGQNNKENLQTLCIKCNRGKSDIIDEEYAKKKGLEE